MGSKKEKKIKLGIKSIGYDIKKRFSPEGLDPYEAVVNQENKIDYKYLHMKPSPKDHFDFKMFIAFKTFFQTIYFGEVLISAIERDQNVFKGIIKKLKKT